jgi:hypothetical protein
MFYIKWLSTSVNTTAWHVHRLEMEKRAIRNGARLQRIETLSLTLRKRVLKNRVLSRIF